MPSNCDLQHRDWLIRTTIKMVQQVDPAITYKIINFGVNQKQVIFDNISSQSLEKLFFLTNTDQNNNYLYLELMEVYLANLTNDTPLPIPGLSELAIELWNQSDSTAFLNGNQTQKPFYYPMTNPCNGEPMDIPTWIDIYSTALNFIPTTTGLVKIFRIVLNPDRHRPPEDTEGGGIVGG